MIGRNMLLVVVAIFAISCNRETSQQTSRPVKRPSILLVTLDTTRADAIGPDAKGIETPAFNAVAARGRRFRFAYATVPETLPSHTSMFTGVYPAAHGIHENARELPANRVTLAERLREAGYRTAAFVSGYPLVRRFGLARGFAVYDDEMTADGIERPAKLTTDRAIADIEGKSAEPRFVWVHYFDPHYPYEAPEPFRSAHAAKPYLGEVASMDQELGRLVDAFRKRHGTNSAILIVGDHGESLGEHGEAQHGNLLYDGAMRVPLVIDGPGVASAVIDVPVSSRRIFHTVLDWAGLQSELSLRGDSMEVVVGEAMKPFLYYGWQPQIMAVENRMKAIHAGKVEAYDLVADPGETRDIAVSASISREMRRTLLEYPVPSLAAQPPAQENLNDEERKKLASLGYVAAGTKPVVRANAPRPRDMAYLFEDLDRASALFSSEDYKSAIAVLKRILAADPENLTAALRIAVAQSALGNHREAEDAFDLAERLSPDSADIRHYRALHLVRRGEFARAVPLLERVLADTPDRLAAVEALAEIREREGNVPDALRLLQRVVTLRAARPSDHIRIGMLAMATGNTPLALSSFEAARKSDGQSFRHDLELGVLLLAARRFPEARNALDRVKPSHPDFAMVLFKRAQVSVLLNEADRSERIGRAKAGADANTRELIAREKLFTQQ